MPSPIRVLTAVPICDGHDSAIVLRSCFRNLLVLGIAKTDPDTADMLSRTRFAAHFRIDGDKRQHHGLFGRAPATAASVAPSCC